MDIQSLLKIDGVNIIDVREEYEFTSGHISDAVNLPLSTFRDYVEEIKNMEGPKVLYCRSGNRSGQAVGFLQECGIKDVHNGGSLALMETFFIKSV